MDLFTLVSNLERNKTFTVEVEIKSKITNEGNRVELLFDTGASNTAICSHVLDKCGYSNFIKGTSKRQTVTGSVTLPRCEVEGFRLVGFQPTTKFTIDVLPNKLLGYQGILGMDYISKFETWISRSRGQLYIAGGFQRFAGHVLDLTKI